MEIDDEIGYNDNKDNKKENMNKINTNGEDCFSISYIRDQEDNNFEFNNDEIINILMIFLNLLVTIVIVI